MDGLLAALAPALPEALVPAEGLAALARLGARLPAGLGEDLFGFECPLGPGQAGADLLVCLSGRAQAGRLLSGLCAASPRTGPWIRLGRLAEAWEDPGHPLHRAIDHLWLEHDVIRGDPNTPSFFFAPLVPRARLGRWEAYEPALEGALRLLLEPRGAEASLEALRRLIAQAPGWARVFQVGAMLGRPGAPLRACLGFAAPAGLPRLLAPLRAGGVRGAEEVEALGPLTALADELALTLDLAEGEAQVVGVECSLHDRGLARPTPRLEALLAALEARGAMTRAQGEALRAWPGACPARPGPQGWPPRRVRTLHHVKLGWRGGLQAKAYLATRPLAPPT